MVNKVNSPQQQAWDDLKSNITRAERILSKDTLSGDEQQSVALLQGQIRDGVKFLKGFDYQASTGNSSSNLWARAMNAAMQSTALKGDAVAQRLNQRFGSPKSHLGAATASLLGLGLGIRYLLTRSVAPLKLTGPSPFTGTGTSPALALPAPRGANYLPYLLGVGALLAAGSIYQALRK